MARVKFGKIRRVPDPKTPANVRKAGAEGRAAARAKAKELEGMERGIPITKIRKA